MQKIILYMLLITTSISNVYTLPINTTSTQCINTNVVHLQGECNLPVLFISSGVVAGLIIMGLISPIYKIITAPNTESAKVAEITTVLIFFLGCAAMLGGVIASWIICTY